MENNYTSMTQDINTNTNTNTNEEPLLLPQKEKEEMTCISKICWWFQIIIWFGGLLLLYFDAYETHKGIFSKTERMTIPFLLTLIFEIMFYICYIIFQFFSPTFSYLLHKKSDVKLYDKMKQLFNSPPKITFVCINYHYETRTVTTYDSKGNASTRTETVMVVTRQTSKIFNYYSSRDVSGLFRLNYDKSTVRDKYYVKLELIKNIDFADPVSYSDFEKEKDEFYRSNLGFDTYTSISVEYHIDGFNEYNLINITENNPCGMSIFWYIFFVLLGVVQIYKSYVNSRCVYKSFTIRKIVSTRYSLTDEESEKKYSNVNPVISYEGEKINFPSNEIGYISSDFQLQIPTEEEIENSQKYKDKIFNSDSIIGDSETG